MSMQIQRSHIFGFIGLVGFAFALYWAKAEAQSARERVVTLQAEVDKERRDVRTLEAEVAWLQRPDRIEATAREKMALVPVTADRMRPLQDLDTISPLPNTAPPAEPVSLGAQESAQ